MSGQDLQIGRTGFFGQLLNLLGIGYSGATLSDRGIRFHAASSPYVAFNDIRDGAEVRQRFGITSLVFHLRNRGPIDIHFLDAENAGAFADLCNRAWERHYRSFFEANRDDMATLADVADALKNPYRYPAACLVNPFLKQAGSLLARMPRAIPAQFISDHQRKVLKRIRHFCENPSPLRYRGVQHFIDSELQDMRQFFDKIESNPLTPEQRLAVVTDEDATLILASAGSGKTSVITAKAAYLIERGIRRPSEILLMAFGRDAASEIAERVQKRCGSAISAMTFHALGYSILRQTKGHAPALADHADDDMRLANLVRDILMNEVANMPGLGDILRRWFGELYFPYKNPWDFKTESEYYKYIEKFELRSLQGEQVKSFEELQIANWLFLNGIEYEYEPAYEHKLPESNRREYRPDFRLTDSGVYVEHFGVRKQIGRDGEERLVTAPFVNRDKYLEDMEWKRKIHAKHETKLVETYSYESMDGHLTESLAKKISRFARPAPISKEKMFDTLKEQGYMDSFSQTVVAFLRHYKSSSMSIEMCREKGREHGVRHLVFLKIFEPFFTAYQNRLGERIDFEDMIVQATAMVRSGRYKSPYRHLLVDEFQDISACRAELLLALKEQHDDARIFAVGDDWQSVFRFAGADISIMRNFGARFGGEFAGDRGIHRVVDLGRTFRSVDKIALPARSFVLKNPVQIKKNVVAAGSTEAPSIMISYYSKDQDFDALGNALRYMEERSGAKKSSVLLLGRYRFVRPANIAAINNAHQNLKIRYMTVHGSKGLEADHVVVLRASAGRLGFPSEVEDNPLLDMVMPDAEAFENAEERRLFYVALTRARYSVTVLASLERPSAFARELEVGREYGAVVIGKSRVATRTCTCGGRMLARQSDGRKFFACEHSFLCGATLVPCTACGNGLPVADKDNPTIMQCACGAEYPACTSCKIGWLVERQSRYGAFLGCSRFPKCHGTRRIRDKNP